MPKINILPAKVYNRIAAGEVVDRPYSVVKELVENSIDAGATEIEIHIEKGGKELIKVIDNGSGIEREDLHAAFLPHATSKIATAEDLDGVRTLGFRGEAIASIASVSKMTITSKTENGKCYSLQSKGGELGHICEVSGEKGTEVCVETLFYNTPVRLGFLRTDKAEESEIITFVSRFVLSRPNISFTCIVNGKTVVQSFGEGQDEAFVSVYGASFLQNCYKIDAERHGIRVRGYIGNQTFYKPNRSYQSVFLNGRYIVNNTIATAIMAAYKDYIMKRQFPVFVLYITMPTDVVDVNVHPNKSDVRFANNGIVYGCITTIIKSILDGNAQALAYLVQPEEIKIEQVQPIVEETPVIAQSQAIKQPQTEQTKSISDTILEMASMRVEEQPSLENKGSVYGFETMSLADAKEEIELCKPILPETQNGEINGITPLDEIPEFKQKYPTSKDWEAISNHETRKKDPERLKRKFPEVPYVRTEFVWDDPQYAVKKTFNEEEVFLANKKFLEELERKDSQNKVDIERCEFVGSLFNTYLMYEYGDDVYIIDQHAAHERVIFDRLKEEMKKAEPNIQCMLAPYELKLNMFEATFIRERMHDLKAMGFEIEESGETDFNIWGVPNDTKKMDIGVFFNEILSEVNGYRAIKLEELLRDKLAMAACKAAVKGGQRLSVQEVTDLLRQMNGDMSMKCPHGRPVAQKITRKQLEKMFKRIV